jgi:streptogramin lyase
MGLKTVPPAGQVPKRGEAKPLRANDGGTAKVSPLGRASAVGSTWLSATLQLRTFVEGFAMKSIATITATFLGALALTLTADGRLPVNQLHNSQSDPWTFVPLSLPHRDPYIDDVATGPDGDVYVTSRAQQFIYRVIPTRLPGIQSTATRIQTPGFNAEFLAMGADGYLYANNGYAIEVLMGDGTLVRKIVAKGDSFGANLVLGPDGNIWACGGWHVESISPQGKVRKYRVRPKSGSANQYQDLVVGPDRKVWFSDAPGNSQTGGFVANVDPSSGKVRSYSLPRGACDETNGIAFGGDENLYVACFTPGYSPIIAQVGLHGHVKVIPYSSGFATIVNDMVAGLDGKVYFSSADGALAAYDPVLQRFDEFQPPVSWVRGVTVGPDGRIWAVAEGYGLDIYAP